MANWPLSAAINYVMRLSVLSPFKESARLVGVYDNILAGTIFCILHIDTCTSPSNILATGQSGSSSGSGWKNIYFRILWGSLAKSEFLWLCWHSLQPEPQHFKGQSGEHVRSFIRSCHKCCHIIWDHIRCILSCSGIRVITYELWLAFRSHIRLSHVLASDYFNTLYVPALVCCSFPAEENNTLSSPLS